LTCPCSSEPPAFEAQECNLVERIDRPQARIEFEAVDDSNWVAEPNVLGAQIAVSVDNAAAANARGERLSLLGEKSALDTSNPPDKPCRQAKARIKQHPQIIRQALVPVAHMDCGRKEHSCRPAVELYERRNEPVELPWLDAMLQDSMFERLSFIETPHDYEPVHNRSVSANRESARRCRERHHVEIDIAGEPTIQAELGPARAFAPAQVREVEVRKTDWFLELVDSIACQEHPGHVGLAASHAYCRMCIRAGPTHEVDLLLERWRANAGRGGVHRQRMLSAAVDAGHRHVGFMLSKG